MPDVRSMYDNKFIGVWNLEGKDVTVTISRVTPGEVGYGKNKEKKPLVYFRGRNGDSPPLPLNKTNKAAIVGMYGNETDNWIGKKITLYPSKASVNGREVDAIRVRPRIPGGPATEVADVPVDEAVRAEQMAAIEAARGGSDAA